MNILGIETSCDETAMAIINEEKKILSHIVFSQIDIHKEFGGVVPEVAARNHLDIIDTIFSKTLKDANLTIKNIDAIAVTVGPGLIGGLIVGTMFAKTLSSILKKPFIAVNHLEGHALTCCLTDNVKFPFSLFLLSGGHCQILEVNGVGNYIKLGETLDDSIGETFDKTAKLLGLEYPGGPKIEEWAKQGNSNRFEFVKPLINHKNKQEFEKNKFNFSFSGLKTAIRLKMNELKDITKQDKYDICASFQKTVTEILADRLQNLINYNKNNKKNINTVVLAGGVSANQYIKEYLNKVCEKNNYNLITPPIKLCTDNGVMIANVGLERYKLHLFNNLSVEPLARWELDNINNLMETKW